MFGAVLFGAEGLGLDAYACETYPASL